MSSHRTVLINCHGFQHAKQLPWSPHQWLFLQICSWQKTFHRCLKHPLSSPDSWHLCSAEDGEEPPCAGALGQEVSMPWQQLDSLRRVYFARRTAPTPNQYKTPTQPERGSVPAGNTYPHLHPGHSLRPSHYGTDKQLWRQILWCISNYYSDV